MSPRAKGRLLGLAVLAVLAGLIVWGLWSAPPPDLMRVAKEFLAQQDKGLAFEAVAMPGAGLAEHWDQASIEQATHMRLQTLGRFLRVVSEQPPEEVREGQRVLRRVRARIAFERKEVDAVFTFRRVGQWRLVDFDVPLKDPKSLGRAEVVLRRAAQDALEQYGRHRWDQVWRALARPVRMGGDSEAWQTHAAALVEPLGTFQRVEEGAWSPGVARGVLKARLVFEQGALDAEVEVVFDPNEGRAVFPRFEVKR